MYLPILVISMALAVCHPIVLTESTPTRAASRWVCFPHGQHVVRGDPHPAHWRLDQGMIQFFPLRYPVQIWQWKQITVFMIWYRCRIINLYMSVAWPFDSHILMILYATLLVSHTFQFSIITCQNLHFGKYVRLSVCYLPKFTIFGKYVRLSVCLSVCLLVCQFCQA